MTGYDERTNTNEHDTGRQEDGSSIGGQHGSTMGVFIKSSLCHKDGIVVALSENKGAQDDIDNIKLDAQQGHDTQDPQPTDGHGEERQQRQRQTAERGPQEEKHDAGTSPADVVEIVGEMTGDGGEEGGI